MTPKGFSGVTWRSMSVVVVTALVLMDTVATDVGEDDCFWSDKTINCFRIDEKLQPLPQGAFPWGRGWKSCSKHAGLWNVAKEKLDVFHLHLAEVGNICFYSERKQPKSACCTFIQRYLRKIVQKFLFCDQELAQNSSCHFLQKILPPTLPFSSWTCGLGSIYGSVIWSFSLKYTWIKNVYPSLIKGQ